ncbi:E3 binding domain-containing protein [Kineococcus sp. SYSU DK005]|uniref:E3 binding domain-containing protein n=1 Tax=Kineococcus sp. SYSU DK005 TaxID=3383126 RepID=UPI003D7E7D00
MSPTPNITAEARQVAAACGIDPTTLRGTGPAGQVVRADVVHQHNTNLGLGFLNARTGTGAGRPAARRASSARATAASGPYTGAAGGLPAFTASGLDPAALLSYPAPVRPAMAAAATAAAAYGIGQRYAGLSDEQAALKLALDTTVEEAVAYAWGNATGFDYQAATRHGLPVGE